MTKKTSSRALPRILLVSGLLALAAVATGLALTSRHGAAAEVVVYKSPTCDCCSKWVEHLEANGFTVDARDVQDLEPIKAEAGIPRRLQSRHTAYVDGYVVEGHVPTDVIQGMLAARPDIHGLAVPGMPMARRTWRGHERRPTTSTPWAGTVDSTCTRGDMLAPRRPSTRTEQGVVLKASPRKAKQPIKHRLTVVVLSG